MAKNILEFKVFIASPGGLDKERLTFKESIEAHNMADGFARGLIYSPVGWEIVLRGVGRPQEIINDQVGECDYFILILWDRWGTPPDTEGKFTSGTEEEYQVALSCYNDASHPLKEIIVLFKAVDPRQLSDPGEQLSKVLAFKKSLEGEKKIFYDTFDDIEALKQKLRRYLSAWTRNHEKGVTLSQSHGLKSDDKFSHSHIIDDSIGNDAAESGFIRDAKKLLLKGNLTDAEAKLVQAVMPGDDLNAYNKYGHFLVESGRLTDAEVIFRRMQEIARDADEASWQGTALAGLALVYRSRDNFFGAAQLLVEAYKLKDLANDRTGKVFVSLWQGDLCVNRRMYEKALEFYGNAYALTPKTPKTQNLVYVLKKMIVVAKKLKNKELVSKLQAEVEGAQRDLKDMELIQRIKAHANSAGEKNK